MSKSVFTRILLTREDGFSRGIDMTLVFSDEDFEGLSKVPQGYKVVVDLSTSGPLWDEETKKEPWWKDTKKEPWWKR